MIQNFADVATKNIYNGKNTKKARKRCPKELWGEARKKMTLLNTAQRLDNLKALPGNRLESLTGSRKGQFFIRINKQYRLCFEWTGIGPTSVEIVD